MIYTVENTVKEGVIPTILLNGKPVEHCVYANTAKGKVRVCREPIRTDRWGKRVLLKTLRGKVEVVLPPGFEWYVRERAEAARRGIVE